MLRSIVVPLDGTPFSEQAIPLGAVLARRASAALEFVHVHVHDGYDDELATLTPYRYEGIERTAQRRELLEKDAEWTYLNTRALQVEQQFGAAAEQLVIDGGVSDALIEHLRKRDADLIVMSTHARAGLDRVRLGSIADDLLHRLNTPLLLLRGQPQVELPRELSFGHVLIPLDGSWLAEDIVNPALALAELSAAHITIFTAKVPGQGHAHPKYLSAVADEVRRQGFGVEFVVFQCNSVVEGIAEYAEQHGVDLIAMATHGRSGVARLLVGSVADEVLHRTRVPLLVVRPEERE